MPDEDGRVPASTKASSGMGSDVKQGARIKQWTGGAVAFLLSTNVLAQSADPKPWQLNMGRGVTSSSHNAYDAHMLALWICVVIGLLVFGAMAVAMFRFRKSRGVVPDTAFTHSTRLEILWTVIPVILLVAMAVPATEKLISMYDTREAEMTVKVTGVQWMWKYDYMGEGVAITSRLDRESDRLRQNPASTRAELEAHGHYLLDVNNPLVLPTNTKIRFVVTADDVIHSWWVPALGWKQDAIPGIVNEAWTEILEPGVYRGQCAELCGKDHGFMPIVVRALPREEFDAWLAAEKAKNAPAAPVEAAPAVTADDAAETTQSPSAPAAPAAG